MPKRRSDGSALKILVIVTLDWPHMVRLSLELSAAGFDVVVLAEAKHPVHRIGGLASESLHKSRRGARAAVAAAIERHTPFLLIPGDDGALGHLQHISASAATPAAVRNAIEASLGSLRAFRVGREKSRLVALAKEQGVLVPDTEEIRDGAQLSARFAQAPFPLVLKQDDSYGGGGVRVIASAREGERAFADLVAKAQRRRVLEFIKSPAGSLLERDRMRLPSICLQAYVDGRPANRAVLSWRGEVLAGLSVEVLETLHSHGPATVVRTIDSPEMADAAARLVRRLGLSGFAGFDFMLDRRGRPHLLEMNQRPTQICHLALDQASDMIGALARLAGGASRRHMRARSTARAIALFPVEMWRDPQSKYIEDGYHDIPSLWPEFVEHYRRPPVPKTLPSALHTAARRIARIGKILAGADERPGSPQ